MLIGAMLFMVFGFVLVVVAGIMAVRANRFQDDFDTNRKRHAHKHLK